MKEKYIKLISSACEGSKKRIFIGLLSLSSFVICLFSFLFLIFPWVGHYREIFSFLSIGMGFIIIIAVSFLCINVIISIYSNNKFLQNNNIRYFLMKVMLPLMEFIGNFFHIDKSALKKSFIKINNEYVLKHYSNISPSSLLLLLPHCLQASNCNRRLSYSYNNCKRCGNCDIGELINIAQNANIHLAIATGGTIARKTVKEIKPKFIVAVACERDLSSGIQDCFPIPVFGILNSRPCGPCKDTKVDLNLVREFLNYILTPSLFSSLNHSLSTLKKGGKEGRGGWAKSRGCLEFFLTWFYCCLFFVKRGIFAVKNFFTFFLLA